jgi:hypothetical protein
MNISANSIGPGAAGEPTGRQYLDDEDGSLSKRRQSLAPNGTTSNSLASTIRQKDLHRIHQAEKWINEGISRMCEALGQPEIVPRLNRLDLRHNALLGETSASALADAAKARRSLALAAPGSGVAGASAPWPTIIRIAERGARSATFAKLMDMNRWSEVAIGKRKKKMGSGKRGKKK